MALPKLLYVYEETDTDGVSYYVSSRDAHEQQNGFVGLYELRETVEVRHKEQYRRKKGKKAEWEDGVPL